MLGENGRTSNVRISVIAHSHYSSLCAEYILGTSKFTESANMARILANMYVKEEPQIRKFSENSRKDWARIGE